MTKSTSGRNVYLIGCGRVGMAVVRGLSAAGYEVVGVRDRDSKAQRRAEKELRRADCRLRNEAPEADIILIATPDSEIAGVYSQLAPALRAGQTVVHFSGAIASLRNAEGGMRTGGRLAMHPVMTFPDPYVRPEVLRDCYFALEGNQAGLAVGRRLVKALGGQAFVLRPADKPLFHAACVFAANFLDVIIDAALEVCRSVRLSPERAFIVLEPLIRQTLDNIAAKGTVRSLSGPAERGDDETIERHLRALICRDPQLTVLYRELSHHARRIARRKQLGEGHSRKDARKIRRDGEALRCVRRM